MDNISFDAITWFVNSILKPMDQPLEILDVGSMDINGCDRELFTNPKWKYTGLDMEAGKNVDLVITDPYHYPLENDSYDVVVANQVAEHVEDIYAWSDELIRILKPGGWMCICAPCVWDEHRYPFDCWRFYPDGLRWLFVKRTGKMNEWQIQTIVGRQCVGIFQKKVAL
jgi:SAM-dependent methyltransferase